MRNKHTFLLSRTNAHILSVTFDIVLKFLIMFMYYITGKPMYIGQPIQCLITKVQSNGRSIILTSDPSVVAEAMADKESHSALQTLLPGTEVPVTVVKVSCKKKYRNGKLVQGVNKPRTLRAPSI